MPTYTPTYTKRFLWGVERKDNNFILNWLTDFLGQIQCRKMKLKIC